MNVGERSTEKMPINAAVKIIPNPIFSLTDFGNAERFVSQHKDDIRYCPKSHTWLEWDGKRWNVDCKESIKRRAMDTVKSILNEAMEVERADDRQRLTWWAYQSQSNAKLNAMIKLAEVNNDLLVKPTDLDTDKMLFNCNNGTIDLRIGKLLEHNRENLITKLAPVDYDPIAKSLYWELFLDQIMLGNQEMIDYLHRVLGYCLTGDTSEQCLFVFHGEGANGKSTLIEVIRAMLGDYASQTDFGTFKRRKTERIRNDIARLRGSRFVSAVEAGQDDYLDEELIKTLTGEDTITSRFLYEEFFEFKFNAKIILAANYKPRITGKDHAIWRRLKLIPFEYTVPELERDRGLKDRLLGILPVILAHAVRGCRQWYADRKLNDPQKVVDATKGYETEMQSARVFVEECCIKDPNAKERQAALYEEYDSWCRRKVIMPASRKRFYKDLENEGFFRRKSGVPIFEGLSLK